MEPKDKKGQEIECYLSGLFPICYLYLQRKPELSEKLVGEMEHHEIPSRSVSLAYLALDQHQQ